MAKIQKNKDPERWLLHRRQGQGPSAATSAMFKADPNAVIGAAPLVHTAGQSRGPGGRALRTVNRGSQGAEQDEEGNIRPKREDDGEGHLDEQLFEEEVADDDEHEAVDMDDEAAKELEVGHQTHCSYQVSSSCRSVLNESTSWPTNGARGISTSPTRTKTRTSCPRTVNPSRNLCAN